MRQRLEAGGFVTITLEQDTRFTGYIGQHTGSPGSLRMDGYVLGESGHLEQISIEVQPEDIHHVQFLPDPPEFIDREGTSIRMEPGFFQDP